MAKKDKVTPKGIVYPEKGTVDEKGLKKAIKGLTDEQVLDWATLEGLTWKPCPEHAAINRMRAVMAIKELHFPTEKVLKKSASPYAGFTTEQLIEMAATNNVPVEVTEDMRILRMRVIMMLRAHGIIG